MKINFKFLFPIFIFSFLTFSFFLFYKAEAAVINKPTNNLLFATGLVGYWTMDGKDINWATGAVTDRSGRGNTGTIVSIATTTGPVIGKRGQALRFNGSTSLINVGTAPTLSEQTVSAWINTATVAAGLRAIYSDFDSAGTVTQFTFYINNTAAKLTVDWGSAVVVTSVASLNANTWYHVVGVRKGSSGSWTGLIYINGVLDTSATTATNPDAAQPASIGRPGAFNGQYFNGLIDDVRVYNYALSASEVNKLYQSGTAKFNVPPTKSLTTGLVGYWTMDGKDINWATGAVTDRSGRGNTGTIVSIATTTGPVIGKRGQALRFNGSTSNINLGSISLAPNEETVSAWIRADTVAAGLMEIVGGIRTDGNGEFALEINRTAGRFGIAWAAIVILTGNVALSSNTWYHVVGVRRGSSGSWTALIYINGVLDNSVTTAVNPNSTGYRIGTLNDVSSSFFNGLIDDVRVYNYALSASEVNKLFQSGAAKFNVPPTKSLATGLVGYWTMDGKDTNWATGAVTDRSGRGNTGTIVSIATTTGVSVGKRGQALRFNGSTSNINIANESNFDFERTQKFSVAFWAKGMNPGAIQGPIIKMSNASPNTGWEAVTNYDCTGANPGFICFELINDVGTNLIRVGSTNAVKLNDGSWHHYSFTYNGSSAASGVKMYEDGISLSTTAVIDTLSASILNNINVSIGSRNNSDIFYTGLLDDVRIYNYALSASEINKLYQATK